MRRTPSTGQQIFAASLPADGQSTTYEVLKLADADLRLNRQFLPAAAATQLFDELHRTVEWQQDTITLFGRRHNLPRLHQWYGDDRTLYAWSGIQLEPKPWFDQLTLLRYLVEAQTGAMFNCVLINLYRNGCDSMGWHADDEPELGNQPVIASVSLGAERDLLLRPRHAKTMSAVKIRLNHGSLLVMAGNTQQRWQHALPKRRQVNDPRINLTFRHIQTEHTIS